MPSASARWRHCGGSLAHDPRRHATRLGAALLISFFPETWLDDLASTANGGVRVATRDRLAGDGCQDIYTPYRLLLVVDRGRLPSQLRYPAPPDRRRRLELFADAYGLASTEGLVDEVIAVQRADLALVQRLAEAGHRRQVAAVAAGELEEIRRWIRWSERHRSEFE